MLQYFTVKKNDEIFITSANSLYHMEQKETTTGIVSSQCMGGRSHIHTDSFCVAGCWKVFDSHLVFLKQVVLGPWDIHVLLQFFCPLVAKYPDERACRRSRQLTGNLWNTEPLGKKWLQVKPYRSWGSGKCRAASLAAVVLPANTIWQTQAVETSWHWEGILTLRTKSTHLGLALKC